LQPLRDEEQRAAPVLIGTPAPGRKRPSGVCGAGDPLVAEALARPTPAGGPMRSSHAPAADACVWACTHTSSADHRHGPFHAGATVLSTD